MKSLVGGRITEFSPREAHRHVARAACGGGVFTTLGVKRGRPIFLPEHVKRLRRESQLASLPQLTEGTLREAVTAVIRANGAPSCVIRLGWLAGGGEARLFALCERARRTPGSIVLQVAFAVGPPRGRYAKSSQLFRWWSLRDQAVRTGVFDLLVVREGFLTESSRFNVFLELDGRLCTPPDTEVFCGIARSALLADSRTATSVMPLGLSQLAAASRVLLVNSVRGCLDVSGVLDPAGRVLWRRTVGQRPRT